MALIEVNNLKKYFKTPRGTVHAVDDVTFKIDAGTTMGVVGESGCGKSTLGRTMIHLNESTDGQIMFDGKDVTRLEGADMRKFREDVQFIFQDPYSSLNPRKTVRETIVEPLMLSKRFTKKQLEEEADRLMDLVGVEQRLRMAYPHELDGGRRQRVGIGRALALNPKFIVCDEPVSALDVSIQAQILNLLMDIQEQMGISYMFITHDLSVVKHISNDIMVMYLGQCVERCESEELFERPLHPYTEALLSAIPEPDIAMRNKEIKAIRGEVTSPINPPAGCRFAARCEFATEKCHKETPQLSEICPGHYVACHKVDEDKAAGKI